MAENEIQIAPLETPEQYHLCEQVQQAIWQSDLLEVTPAHVLISAQRHGGLVLGAFDPTGQMIGCLFGFPGRVAPDNLAAAGAQWQHYSHQMGVLPAWRGQGVGYRLKLAQRDWALRQGFEVITWTFDPLEAANSTLNLGKLGAICRCYLRDLYGQMADGLNAGLPTDRFEVTWWIESARVQERVAQGWQPPRLSDLLDAGAAILNPGRVRPDGLVEPGPLNPPEGARLLVEIPARFQAIKASSHELAQAWRISLRQACESAFAAGYTACDAVRAEVDGVPRLYYVLESL